MIRRVAPTRPYGFSLIELMITVAIVGILAMVALPSYSNYIQRSKIIDGTTKLGDYRAEMEKYFLDNRRYTTAVGSGVCGVPIPASSSSDQFVLSCPGPTDTTYTAVATGIPARGMSASFVYRVNQANARSSNGPAGWTASAVCWAVRKDGSCG